MYNPKLQYRCTIIRGKAQKELDNLLPAYCQIITTLCPIEEKQFTENFNKMLSTVIHTKTSKTLNNHRTEIAGKLFGLWYLEDGIVNSSQLAEMLVETEDNPAFFKNLIIKLQFPNGMDKRQTIEDRIANKIKFRPAPFILASLIYAKERKKTTLSKREIAYYILNSLEVLQGKVTHESVVERIIADRELGVHRHVRTPDKASSYDMQHINEQLNLLALANLIYEIPKDHSEKYIYLNTSENLLINKIVELYLDKVEIDPDRYDFYSDADVRRFYNDWERYYTTPLADGLDLFTKINNLIRHDSIKIENTLSIPKSLLDFKDPNLIGDEGEMIVIEYEKNRVKKFNTRLANKVIHFGKQRGLGYDISSILAEGDYPEHAIYIEVKTTKRVTEPNNQFNDRFEMTRNEWVAAEQHEKYYFIYRVYIFNEGVKIFKMLSPISLKNEKRIFAEPTKYNIEFNQDSGTFIYEK